MAFKVQADASSLSPTLLTSALQNGCSMRVKKPRISFNVISRRGKYIEIEVRLVIA